MKNNTAALVFAIVGAILGTIGAIMWATCAETCAGIVGSSTGYTIGFIALGIGGAVVSLIGGVQAFGFKKAGGGLSAFGLYPLLLFLKKKRMVGIYERMCDLASAIPAGHCLGRISCFFGGCCFGKPTDCIFGVTFPAGSAPYEYYGGAVSVHPTQLYEAAFLLLLFVFLRRFGKDRAFPLYLILYGTGRFFIEFLRGDERGALLPFLSPAQTLSILFVLVGAAVLFWRRKIGKAQKNQV